MKYTNNHNFSDIVKTILLHSDYDEKKTDMNIITASEMADSNKQIILKKRHNNECTADVSSLINMVYGSMFHNWAEIAIKKLINNNEKLKDRYIIEKRLNCEIDNISISGKFDIYDVETKTLYDYKTNTIAGYKSSPNGKLNYIIQTNIYKWLLEKSGYEVNDIKLINILKDWRPSESKKEKNYPNINIVEHSVILWSADFVNEWIKQRVKSYKEDLLKSDDDIEKCSETWGDKRCKDYCICNKFCNCYKQQNH
jgi:hypothetical protein